MHTRGMTTARLPLIAAMARYELACASLLQGDLQTVKAPPARPQSPLRHPFRVRCARAGSGLGLGLGLGPLNGPGRPMLLPAEPQGSLTCSRSRDRHFKSARLSRVQRGPRGRPRRRLQGPNVTPAPMAREPTEIQGRGAEAWCRICPHLDRAPRRHADFSLQTLPPSASRCPRLSVNIRAPREACASSASPARRSARREYFARPLLHLPAEIR